MPGIRPPVVYGVRYPPVLSARIVSISGRYSCPAPIPPRVSASIVCLCSPFRRAVPSWVFIDNLFALFRKVAHRGDFRPSRVSYRYDRPKVSMNSSRLPWWCSKCRCACCFSSLSNDCRSCPRSMHLAPFGWMLQCSGTTYPYLSDTVRHGPPNM